MTIDNKFYSVIQTNTSLNSQNSVLPQQEFSQILAQTMQNKETQSQAKFTGNVYEDGQNGLLNDEEKRVLPVIISAAQFAVGSDFASKVAGVKLNDFDINFDEFGGLVKQRDVLANGTQAEKMALLTAYKQALENGRVIPQDGRQGLNVAIEYINKALGNL